MVCLNTERTARVEHQLTKWEKDATCSGLIKTCNSKQEIVSSQDWHCLADRPQNDGCDGSRPNFD